MSRIVICLALLFVTGCSQHRYDVADPVVGPAPPRRDLAQPQEIEKTANAGLQLASYSEDEIIPMTEVVARVNGTPILAGQVLEPYAAKLIAAQKQLPASEVRKAQEMLLKKDLQAQVEQTLMVDAIKSKMKKEQLDQINEQLDEFFLQEIDRLKTQFKVANAAELEGLLQSQGMSLSTMREMFGNRQLASEYIRGKMGEATPLSRQNLIEEYNRRLAEYEIPEQIKWQQIQVSTAKQGSKVAARGAIEQALAEVHQGVDFSTVARKYSDGPLKESGGHWDWTQPESIASTTTRETLAQLQQGQLSGIVDNGSSFQILKVTGRKAATHTPFEEVQEQIRTDLLEEERKSKAKEIIAKLKDDAIIETMFDEA